MKLILNTLFVLCTSIAFATSTSTIANFNEIAGTTDGYNIKNKDGFVDFSLVIPAVTLEELMIFDLARIISPENDVLNILSREIVIPSNLSFPKQVESYFLSFTLDKLDYRTYLQDLGQYTMYGLHGTFPIKKVVDAAQAGQSIFEMVNLFTFKGGGAEPVDVKGPTKDIKVAINQWTLDTTNTITVPILEKNKEVLTFSLFKSGNELYPADIKRVLSGKTQQLTNRNQFENYVLAVLVNTKQNSFIDAFHANNGNITAAIFGSDVSRATFDLNQISYNFQKVDGATPLAATFLPQVSPPAFDKQQNLLSFTPPQTIVGVSPYSMIVTLSEITPAGSENLPLDVKNNLWYSEYSSWQQSAAIPTEVTQTLQTGKTYAWDVLFLGTPQTSADSKVDWSKVSHITRSRVVLKL